jgi:hypothetical protein
LPTEHLYPEYGDLVRACQRINMRLVEYRQQFPRQETTRYHSSTTRPAIAANSTTPRPRQGLLPAPRYFGVQFKSSTDKRDPATPGPRDSPARETDPTKATCFNCGEVGHFSNSCPNPR